LVKPASLEDLLKRTELDFGHIQSFDETLLVDDEISDQVEIAIKYEGYIKRQNELIEHTKRLEGFRIPESLDFGLVVGLSSEEKEKLTKIRPTTLGQAHRISGVNPSAIQALLIHLKGRQKIKGIMTHGTILAN